MKKKPSQASPAPSETQTEVPGTPAKRTRKVAVLPVEVQALVDEQKQAAAKAQAQVKETTKEARKLGKVVSLIAELGEWSLDQLGITIERRRKTIADARLGINES